MSRDHETMSQILTFAMTFHLGPRDNVPETELSTLPPLYSDQGSMSKRLTLALTSYPRPGDKVTETELSFH
jgi:hypothetical protein